MGEVMKPGTYELFGGMTIQDLIIKAGGVSKYANRNETRLIRADGSALAATGRHTPAAHITLETRSRSNQDH